MACGGSDATSPATPFTVSLATSLAKGPYWINRTSSTITHGCDYALTLTANGGPSSAYATVHEVHLEWQRTGDITRSIQDLSSADIAAWFGAGRFDASHTATTTRAFQITAPMLGTTFPAADFNVTVTIQYLVIGASPSFGTATTLLKCVG